jgi:hypothetical protein
VKSVIREPDEFDEQGEYEFILAFVVNDHRPVLSLS